MIQVRIDERGVSDVRIIAWSKEEEHRNFLFWPTIRKFVQEMNEALEKDFEKMRGNAALKDHFQGKEKDTVKNNG